MSTAHRLLLSAAVLAFALTAHAGQKEDIQAAMQTHNWEQADRLLQKTLTEHPNNSLAHYWRAQVQVKLGDLKQAGEELAEAKRIDPAKKFASNPQVLAELEASIEVMQASQVAKISPPPVAQEIAAPAPVVQAAANSNKRGLLIGLAIAVGALVSLLLIFWPGRAKRRELAALRIRARDELNEARQALEDAQAWSDGNAALSPEQKLGNYDRINKLKAVANELITKLPQMKDFDAFDAVPYMVGRCKDEAADIRGEEKPSVRAARTAEAAAQRQHEMYMEQAAQRTMPAVHQGGLDGSMFTTALLLNSMDSGHQNAHAAPRPMFSNDSTDESRSGGFGIDIGGTSGGDASFGSADTGGSSGGGDTSF